MDSALRAASSTPSRERPVARRITDTSMPEPRTADASQILQGKQSLQGLHARVPLRGSASNVPIVQPDQCDRYDDRNKDEHYRRHGAAVQESDNQIRAHNSSPQSRNRHFPAGTSGGIREKFRRTPRSSSTRSHERTIQLRAPPQAFTSRGNHSAPNPACKKSTPSLLPTLSIPSTAKGLIPQTQFAD